MKIYNKYYRKLRQEFYYLELKEFLEIYNLHKKLNMQYKMLKIANFLEKLDMKYINVPILHFLSKFFDFLRWKVYDFCMLMLNGKQFNLFGVTIFCGRQRIRKNNRNCGRARTY